MTPNPTFPQFFDKQMIRLRRHGRMAALCLLFGLVVQLAWLWLTQFSSMKSSYFYEIGLLRAFGLGLWIWGCCHLALRFELSPLWGLAGFALFVGPFVILWAGKEKPSWDIAAKQRAFSTGQINPVDTDSPY